MPSEKWRDPDDPDAAREPEDATRTAGPMCEPDPSDLPLGNWWELARPIPAVVHCRRSPFDVYIGRPSKWGNPFIIGRDGERDEVIEKYRRWIQTQPRLLQALPELRGKVLGCWCAPKPCHGDVLLELANAEDTQTP